MNDLIVVGDAREASAGKPLDLSELRRRALRSGRTLREVGLNPRALFQNPLARQGIFVTRSERRRQLYRQRKTRLSAEAAGE